MYAQTRFKYQGYISKWSASSHTGWVLPSHLFFFSRTNNASRVCFYNEYLKYTY